MISTDDMREAAKWEGVTDPLGAAVLEDAANEIDRLRAEMDEWQRAAQAVVDLFDPCEHKVDPGTLVLIAKAAKQANRGVRTERDAALAKLAELRGLLGGLGTLEKNIDSLRAWLAAGGRERP